MRAAGVMGVVACFILAVPAAVAEGATTDSCYCIQSVSLQEELRTADAVFTGKVLEVAGNSYQKRGGEVTLAKRVRLQIVESFKGPRAGEVEVFTDTDGAACTYHFETAPAHLVFAHKNADGKLWVSLCSRTKALSPDRHPVEREELRLDLEALRKTAGGGKGRGCAGCNASGTGLLLGLLALLAARSRR